MKTIILALIIVSIGTAVSLNDCSGPPLCDEVFESGTIVVHKLLEEEMLVVSSMNKQYFDGTCHVKVRKLNGTTDSFAVIELDWKR